MPTATASKQKIERVSKLRWVPLAEMRVSTIAQREYSQAHAEEYAADFDLEGFGFPVVNLRDGHWYIVDGQHRVGALRLIGWGDQMIECEAYEGLTEAEEAELFLKRNRRRNTSAFDTFRIAIEAHRPVEVAIEKVVRSQGLHVSQDTSGGAISAVGSLRRSFDLDGTGVALARSLNILYSTFGDTKMVFKSELVYGMALVAHRYATKLDDKVAVDRLGRTPAGVVGLLTKVHLLKKNFGRTLPQCAAAAIVEAINTGRGGHKLESWVL